VIDGSVGVVVVELDHWTYVPAWSWDLYYSTTSSCSWKRYASGKGIGWSVGHWQCLPGRPHLLFACLLIAEV